VICELCDRRMFGKTRRGLAYYACEPDRRHHAQRAGWYPGHPSSLWVREDVLLGIVHGFFAERIFGPRRHDLLAAQLASRAAPQPGCNDNPERQKQLQQAISDIERRKRTLVTELESQPVTGDPGAGREYREAIQRRFTELVAEHRAKAAELARLTERPAEPATGDPDLLQALPQIPLRLADLPEPLQRSLYDAFQLQVRYHRPRHEVTIRATIRAETLDSISQAVSQITKNEKKPGNRSHVLGAPSRIRTCAPASGGRCSIP
jgi:site-specific DNA recombinase